MKRLRALIDKLGGPRVVLEDSVKLFTILSALWAGGLYISEVEDRRLERLYRAWDVVGRAASDTVNGARDGALSDLAKHDFPMHGLRLPGVRLWKINLQRADMRGVKLQKGSLRDAVFTRAILAEAELDYAEFQRSHFDEADLSSASLVSTQLPSANFTRATLIFANLQRAILVEANLTDANAFQADFREAQLGRANVAGANFERADLRDATITDLVNWRSVRSLRRANLAGVVGAPEGFVRWAIDSMGAVDEPADSAWEQIKYGSDSVEVAPPAAQRAMASLFRFRR